MIDLDAAMGRGANDALVEMLASRAVIRAGGGVRTVERARDIARAGRASGHRRNFGIQTRMARTTLSSQSLVDAIGRDRIVLALDSKGGRIVVKGWQEATRLHRRRSDPAVGALLLRISVHLCGQGRHDAGNRSRLVRRLRAATNLEITAAGGITTIEDIRALEALRIHSAVGMAIYTGRLDLTLLASQNRRIVPQHRPAAQS